MNIIQKKLECELWIVNCEYIIKCWMLSLIYIKKVNEKFKKEEDIILLSSLDNSWYKYKHKQNKKNKQKKHNWEEGYHTFIITDHSWYSPIIIVVNIILKKIKKI